MHRFLIFLILIKIHLITGCRIPRIENGQVVNTNGKVLKVGTNYDDFDPVSIKCSAGFSILTIRPIDNEVLCSLDSNNWNQEFKECQSNISRNLI